MNKEIEEIKKEFLLRCKREISKKSSHRNGGIKEIQDNLKKLEEFIKKLTPMINQVVKDKKYELTEKEGQKLLDELQPKIHELISQYWEK
jgi:lantibiotic modifying enzyme